MVTEDIDFEIEEIEDIDLGVDAVSDGEFSEPPPKDEEREKTPEELFEDELEQAEEKHRDHIRRGRESCQQVMMTLDRSDWKQVTEKEGVTVCQYDVQGGKKCTKGEGFVDFTPTQIFDFLQTPNIQKGYDDRFDEGGEVEALPMETSFQYNKFKGIMFVQGRDFCFISHKQVLEDGTIIVGASSCEHPDCPPVRGKTRGVIEIAGWIMRPEGKGSNVAYIT